MAAAKKQSSGSSKKSTGTGRKSSASTKKTTASSKKTTANTKKIPDTGFHMTRRMAGLIICIIAILLTLSMFGLTGFIIDPLWKLFTGMIGWGIYPFVVLLFAAALLLVWLDIKPYKLRTICVLIIPFLYSSIVQCVVIGDKMPMSFSSFGRLWSTGIKLHSAGVISGVIAVITGAAFSQTGAKLILSFLLAVCVFTAINRTPWGLVKSLIALIEDDKAQMLSEDDMTVSPRQSTNESKTDKTSFWTAKRAKAKQKKALKRIEKAEQDKAAAEKILQNMPQESSAYEQEHENSQKTAERQKKLDEVMPQNKSYPETENKAKFSDIDRMMNQFMYAEPDEQEIEQKKDRKSEEKAKAQLKSEIQNAMTENTLAPYLPPSIDLLNKPKKEQGDSQADLDKRAAQLLDTLDSFGIEARLYGRPTVGPTVTLFEIQIERGVKISRITSLTDDIGLALGSPNVRLFMVPEHGAVGIEVANHKSQTVYIRDVLGSKQFERSDAALPVALGKDITGKPRIIDLAKMPHLMIAGTTGSGKSVCINSLMVSLLYKFSKDELRLIMIDPKMVELANYNGIPHLLIPVVTDAKKASGALNWAVGEMDRRYAQFAAEGVRKIEDYNELIRKKEAEEDVPPFDTDENAQNTQPIKQSKIMPRIVIVIDELADLMMVASKEVEGYICRLAQKARAAGMYLVVATQRPSADVITGLMKSNIPSRIAFAVASGTESRIIMDTTGAEKLMGHGDMLYHPLGASEPLRIQGCFISTEEIERVIAHVKTTAAVEYSEEIQNHIDSAGGDSAGGYDASEDEDPMLNDAINVVVSGGQASTSMLQRRLKLGYARAARVMDQMEERGIVGPSEGSKPRRVLISKEDWMEMQLRRDI